MSSNTPRIIRLALLIAPAIAGCATESTTSEGTVEIVASAASSVQARYIAASGDVLQIVGQRLTPHREELGPNSARVTYSLADVADASTEVKLRFVDLGRGLAIEPSDGGLEVSAHGDEEVADADAAEELVAAAARALLAADLDLPGDLGAAFADVVTAADTPQPLEHNVPSICTAVARPIIKMNGPNVFATIKINCTEPVVYRDDWTFERKLGDTDFLTWLFAAHEAKDEVWNVDSVTSVGRMELVSPEVQCGWNNTNYTYKATVDAWNLSNGKRVVRSSRGWPELRCGSTQTSQ